MFRHLPNILTLTRIACAPFLWWAILSNAPWSALFILAFAMTTDFFDGRVARRYDLTSKSGTFLDPLADKILILSGFGALAAAQILSPWVVIVIAARDVFVTLLRFFCLSRGYALRTSWFAKSKTAIQFIALHLFIIGHGYLSESFGPIGFSFKLVMYKGMTALSFAVVVLTVLSGITYLWQMRKRSRVQESTRDEDVV